MIKTYFMAPVRFDCGAVALLPKELRARGIRRPLLVTDAGLVACGQVERVRALMPDGVLFCDLDANPTAANVDAGVRLYREQGCDGLVALGGGSAIDCAKGISLLATHEGRLADYDIMKVIRREGRLVTAAAAPIIAIPTTAGTGSEVATSAVFNIAPGEKIAVINDNLLPKVVLADPELTLTLPRGLTAGTGMDALTHCIEGVLSRNANPPAKAVGIDGAARIFANIRRACAAPDDRAARSEMMMGAIEGGMTMLNGCGAIHALSQAIGGLHELNLHHGTLNAVLMPAVLRFNAPHAGEWYAKLRVAFALPPDADLADTMRALAADLGMPSGLAAMGITRGMIPALADAALRDISGLTNPCDVTAADYARLLAESL